ncbi:MAG: starch synthase, partial [Candidatus Zixiibacteriota bacterium]
DESSLTGTGFVFEEYDSGALLSVIEKGVGLFGRKRTWSKIIKQAMSQDFSWEKSAAQYSDLYHKILQKT